MKEETSKWDGKGKEWEELKKRKTPIKKDSDFVYLDGAFCMYILDQTNYVKVKAELIEILVNEFREKLSRMPVGMLPTEKLINEFSKGINHLEKAHALLALELMRLKGMEYVQQAYSGEENKENAPDPDVSVV